VFIEIEDEGGRKTLINTERITRVKKYRGVQQGIRHGTAEIYFGRIYIRSKQTYEQVRSLLKPRQE
jgi:hypothetical protein